MNKKIIIPSILGIIFVLLLSASIYFYRQYESTKKMLNSPNSQTKNDKEKLMKEIGALIYLPKEDPVIATVTDKKKLENQPFFTKAQNGDVILLYQKNHQAILYRPSINKIIEVSQINLAASPSASVITPLPITPTIKSSTPTIINKIKLAIYNGTKIKGLAAKKGDLVTEKAGNFEVIDVDNTVGDYNLNMIVNLKKVSASVIQQLNKIIPAKVVALPKGETAPTDADLLLIIGKE